MFNVEFGMSNEKKEHFVCGKTKTLNLFHYLLVNY